MNLNREMENIKYFQMGMQEIETKISEIKNSINDLIAY